MLLIHVGKCGGSNITYKIKDKHEINIKSMHVHSKNINQKIKMIQNNKDICLMVRDPITRFLSIFYYWKNLYEDLMLKKDIPHKNEVKKYIKFFKMFKSANELAEALSSNNYEFRKLAYQAINNIIHFKEGFKFYLINEDVIKNNINNFKFIIRQEHYNEDFKKYYHFICLKFGIKPDINYFLAKKRNNTDKYNNDKNLSELAIKNLKEIFKHDYEILNLLVKYKILNKEYFDNLI